MAGGIGGFLGKGKKKKEEEELNRREAEERLRANQEREKRALIVGEARRRIWEALKNKDKEHLRFICAHDLEQIWTLNRIAQLSKGLNWSTHELQTWAQKYFVKVMSTLVWIKWDDWEEFGRLFLEHLDRTDKHLPLQDTSFLQTEELQTFFRDQQYLFNPVVIMEDDEDASDIDIHYSERYSEKHRMPFLNTATIGEGSSGTVTKEVIAPGHLMYRTGVVNKDPVLVARKRIPRPRAPGGRDEESFLTEQKSLKFFKRCLEGNSNIMLSYTSFTHGPYFTIISPLADLDLHTFFHGTYKEFQVRSQGFAPAHLLYGASCLAGALKFLHEGLRPRGIGAKIYCAHLDLKPENILVVWKGNIEPAGRWLVHDFGTSKIKETSSARTLAPGDFLRQFSLTQPQRAPGPFQAPEVQRSNERVVGRESDIWSLGCILAVVLAFACGGPLFVKRLAESKTEGDCADDYFYTRNDSGIILKDKVVRWLESLNTGSPDNAWIRETLTLIYSTLVEKPSKRPSAERVQGSLENIWNQRIDSLQNVCLWVPKELSCESPEPARPIRRPRISDPPAEPMERLRIPESPSDIRWTAMGSRRQTNIEPGIEVVPSASPLTPSTGQFSSTFRDSYGPEGLRASGQPTSRSSSISAIPLNLTNDTTFMKLEVPKDAFRSVMCPSACHVTFLSKKRATIVRLGNEGTWIANPKPPKIENDSRTRSIPCPDNWEWDFASMAGAYLILRSKRPGGRERKVYRYKCADYGYVWDPEPLFDTGNVPLSTALDIVVSILGDIIFVHDEHLWYYCSRNGLLIELFTQGHHRAASACFSSNGRWVFGWSHEPGYNNFYKWDTTQWDRIIGSNSNRTLKEEWKVRSAHNNPQRGPGIGNPALFPFLDYCVAFDRPQYVYTIGKNASNPDAVLVSKPFRDIVSGVGIQGIEGPRKVESLILLQNDRPGFLMTLSMTFDGASPSSAGFKLQYQFTPGSDAIAVLNTDSKFYVIISHADGKLERRRVSST